MLHLSLNSKAEFLASLARLTSEATALPHDEIVSAFKSVPENDFTSAEWYEVVEFALNQIGEWQVKWLFSPAQAPDTRAQTETDAWERLWDVFSQTLVDKVPEIKEQLRRKKDLLISQRLLQQKLQQDRGNPAAALAASMMGRLAIALNRLGCGGIARRLYKRALYPSGTVGRAQG